MWETPANTPVVVFANLDELMLEGLGRPGDPVRPALALPAVSRIPVVLVSSRTRAEIEVLGQRFGVQHPFVAENGAAVYIPAGYFPAAPSHATTRSGYHVVETPVSYRDVVSTLHRLARQLRVGIESFSQMSVEEVGRACGLSLLDARLAKLRDHAEPFRFTDATPKARLRLVHALQCAGFQCVHDGRFCHAGARVDIGERVRLLKELYGDERRVMTAGIASRSEDLQLLREVDIPVVVQVPTGRATAELFQALPQAVLTRGSGAAGWAEAITSLVQRFAGLGERSAA